MNKLGLLVKNRRLRLARTQNDYARLIDITRVTLIKIEQGKPVGINIIRKLSDFYRISTEEIRKQMLEEVD